MPATLGDHRGIIKAAVTVVNRAANKGGGGCRKHGGCIMGDCPSFVLSLVCFARCDLPVWRYIEMKRITAKEMM